MLPPEERPGRFWSSHASVVVLIFWLLDHVLGFKHWQQDRVVVFAQVAGHFFVHLVHQVANPLNGAVFGSRQVLALVVRQLLVGELGDLLIALLSFFKHICKTVLTGGVATEVIVRRYLASDGESEAPLKVLIARAFNFEL